MKKKKLRVIQCNVGESPRIATIPATLEALQSTVGGYVEAHGIAVMALSAPPTRPLVVLCDEDGGRKGLPPNRTIARGLGWPTLIVGNFIIVAQDGPEFASLTDAEIDSVRAHLGGTIFPEED